MSRSLRSGGLWLLLALGPLLSACDPQVVLPSPEDYPQRLSEWRMVWRDGDGLQVNGEARVYDLNMPLFSDYALKLRTLYLPEGTTATWHPYESFDFPVGTIVTKTFFYPIQEKGHSLKESGHTLTRHSNWSGAPGEISFKTHRIVETRLLVRQPHGWDALPYVWEGEDAFLSLTGKVLPLTLDEDNFAYVVPSRNECGSCHITNHTDKRVQPIGLKARHLDRTSPTEAETSNQLSAMVAQGWLSGIPDSGEPGTAGTQTVGMAGTGTAVRVDGIKARTHTVAWTQNASLADPTRSLEDRARSYLDINCGHCHNQFGAADTSGLLLDIATTDPRKMGQCKPTIAAGRGSGGRLYGIVPGKPDDSILLWRMQTTDPGARMPELGRSLVHNQGVTLIRDWIASRSGEC